MNNNCIICGKRYKVCRTCDKNRNIYFGWRTICDTAECYQAYIAITGVRDGVMPKEKAKNILEKLAIENYTPEVKKQVEEICKQNIETVGDKSKAKNKKAEK